MRGVQSDSDDANELVFDLVGVDASIANALRRILLSEVSVPYLAELLCTVTYWYHTLLHDEESAQTLSVLGVGA